MKIKNAAKIVIFCILFLFLLNRIYDIFSWKDTAGDYYSSMETFYDLEKDTVDVLFLGSSHCYCSVIPAKLWEDYGMASFNMAISGQDLASSYYSFKEALKTQDLEVVCVELYGCVFHGYLIEGNLYRNTLSRKLSLTSMDAVNNIVETDNKSDFILKWPIIHTRYKELKKQDFMEERPAYLGYSCEFNVSGVEKWEFDNVEPKPFGEAEQEWLLKIIELAEESDTELVFFLVPYQMSLEAQEYIAYAKEMIAEYDVPVIDMLELSEDIDINWRRDFSDYGHTNHFGAQKVTAYLGEFLKNNYDLQDYRGDERYTLWDLDLKTRQHEMTNYRLEQIADMELYFGELSQLEDYTIVVSTTGEYLSENANIESYLQMLGSFHEFAEGSKVWVIDNKENIYTSSGSEFLVNMPLSYGELVLSGTNGNTSVLVDRVSFCKVTDGVNILIYDNLQGKVVSVTGFDAKNSYIMVR